MPGVYVSIGSNVEREKNIRGALRALKERYRHIAASSVYQSKAEGFDGDDFYNLVAAFATDEPLEALRQTLAEIETAHGRMRDGPRFGARTLDLDILLYGDTIRHDGRFDIPRPEITQCAYVLRPLAELAPEATHPENGARFADLWRTFGKDGDVRMVMLEVDHS
jgi:2-amino-4-hydroxy-6-hydroxymethyldihydropteridine diphosphokinase